MKRAGIALTLSALAALGAGLFAVDRFFALAEARERHKAATADLQTALRLAAQYPRVFGPEAAASPDSALKVLAQESARDRGVTIGFLSESEREAEKGRRERQVLVRLVHANHKSLVFFLQDLESRGSGAKVKELHLRPSRDAADAYEEAEIVLSKVIAAPENKP